MSTETSVAPDTLLQQLKWRYATKKFDTGKKIPAPVWKSLEEALLLSPSSFGLQPWKFIVVTNADVRKKLQAVSWNQTQIVDASHLVVFAVKKDFGANDVDRLIKRISEVRHAPLESLDAYKQIMLGHVKAATPEALAVWNSRQVYIALGTFLTSAAMVGIDACPMEGIVPAEYDKVLGLDAQGYQALCVATAGYRAADDAYAELAKVRYPADDVLAHVL
jgi:nitroreductase